MLTLDDPKTDLLRLKDLARQHGLAYRKHGRRLYYFDDRTGDDAFSDGCIFIGRGLREALAFAEGFDRAMGKKTHNQNEKELRRLEVFHVALRKSGLGAGPGS